MDLQKEADNQSQENGNSAKEIKINENKLNAYIEKLKLEQNLPMAILAGLVACLVGALLWAVITVATEYQIGYMAIAVGFIVGYAVRFMGKGLDPIFGVIGAAFALLGCLLGNFFSLVGFAANDMAMTYVETLGSIDYGIVPEVMMETFSPIDLLFYGFAIYEGYKFAIRPITEEEIREHATDIVVSNSGSDS